MKEIQHQVQTSLSDLKIQRDALTVQILAASFSDKPLPYQIGCLASEVQRGFGNLQKSMRVNAKSYIWTCAKRFERENNRQPAMLDLIAFVS
jgi:hypothetical protein